MPKLLPASDFRSRRRVLLRSDFAYAPKPAKPPNDKIDEATWNHIVTLPDDVAVRTTNYHGTTIREILALTDEWLNHCDGDDFISRVMLDAHDDFDAALYNAITGFYRLANSTMRSALELVTIGTWAQVCGKRKEFEDWEKGKIELTLGRACDGLISATSSLRDELSTLVNDSLFDQRTPKTEGGWVRRAFSSISDFSHSRPGYTDGALRNSNGPIYVRDVFNHTIWTHTEILGLLFVLVLIARPKIRFSQIVVDLFADVSRVKSRVTRGAFKVLHP